MTFRCKSIFDFIFHFSFIKIHLFYLRVKHFAQKKKTKNKYKQQQYQIIDEIVAHQCTICRWNSAIEYVHMNWIKWAPNHLCEIRDIHIDLVDEVDLFLLYSLLDERDMETQLTLTSK